MHPLLVQDLARQRIADLDRDGQRRRLVAIARSAGGSSPARDVTRQLRRVTLAAGRLRLAIRGSAG